MEVNKARAEATQDEKKLEEMEKERTDEMEVAA